MGNTSDSEYGGIMIRTEKQLYFAGDVVKGQKIVCDLSQDSFIYTSLRQDFRENSLNFQLLGKKKQDGVLATEKIKQHIMERIFSMNKLLLFLSFINEHLQVGQFSFPFELHLPTELPGSYFLDQYLLAQLTYKVKARVISTNKSINDIKNKQQIIVREPIKELIRPIIMQDTTQITTCCCLQKGVLKGKISKNLYFLKEFIEIQIDADNTQCELDIKKIDVSIINRLTISSNGGSTLVTGFKICKIAQNGIQKGMKITSLEQKTCKLQIQYPKKPELVVAPSSNGNFVNSVYYVVVKPTFGGCTYCSSKPKVYLPFTVLAKLPQEYLLPLIKPDNWQPQEFSPLIIKPSSDNPFQQQNKKINQMHNPMQHCS